MHRDTRIGPRPHQGFQYTNRGGGRGVERGRDPGTRLELLQDIQRSVRIAERHSGSSTSEGNFTF